MFGLGVPELIVILVVVLLIFGPRKLPELGTFVGRSLKDFREALDQKTEGAEPSAAPEPPAAEARASDTETSEESTTPEPDGKNQG